MFSFKSNLKLEPTSYTRAPVQCTATRYSLELLNDEVARPAHLDFIDDGCQLGALGAPRQRDLSQAQWLYARYVQLRDALGSGKAAVVVEPTGEKAQGPKPCSKRLP